MKIFFCVLLVISLHAFSAPVMAQDSLKPVDPAQYQYAKQQEFAESFFASSDPATLSEEEWTAFLEKTSITGEIPLIGGVSGDNGVYRFSTGIAGVSRGTIPYGVYWVSVTPIQGIRVSAPTLVRIDPANREMSIGLQTNAKMMIVQNWLSWLKGKLIKSHTPTAVVYPETTTATVIVFDDHNRNGKRESAEKIVPWANVQATFMKVSTEKLLEIQSGTTSIEFDRIPFGISSTEVLLRRIHADIGGDLTLIRPDTSSTISFRNGTLYGVSEKITPNTPYLLTTGSSGSIVLSYY